MTERGLRFPALRLVREGETLPPALYTKSARIQSRKLDDVIDPGRVLEHFADGATIVLQALHRVWTPLAHFCRDLERTLTHPVQVNVYLTPPVSQGLDIHYDTHDVFVLQVSGVKHWRVWGSALDLPLAHQRRKGRFTDPGTPQIDIELKPGDALYIPRGFLHAAETSARESAHMTVGILAYTWMDVVERALRRAPDQLFLREALPPGFAHAPADLGASASAKLDELARWLATIDGGELVDEVADGFWASRAPVLSGQLEEVLDLDSLSDGSRVRMRPGAVARVSVRGNELVVTLGDRRLVMPAWLEPALAYILGAGAFAVADLSEHLDEPGRLVLVRRLIREGLLQRSPGD